MCVRNSCPLGGKYMISFCSYWAVQFLCVMIDMIGVFVSVSCVWFYPFYPSLGAFFRPILIIICRTKIWFTRTAILTLSEMKCFFIIKNHISLSLDLLGLFRFNQSKNLEISMLLFFTNFQIIWWLEKTFLWFCLYWDK